ncbi:hypothetical protein BZA77DRAFT_315290 [Pyronema omphalodes]|nr:hypothetical protein BZA77DRAFT_315290 [Pyronema omphalodes]
MTEEVHKHSLGSEIQRTGTPLIHGPYHVGGPTTPAKTHTLRRMKSSANLTPDVPKGWVAHWDEKEGAWYYTNTNTNLSQWTAPASSANLFATLPKARSPAQSTASTREGTPSRLEKAYPKTNLTQVINSNIGSTGRPGSSLRTDPVKRAATPKPSKIPSAIPKPVIKTTPPKPAASPLKSTNKAPTTPKPMAYMTSAPPSRSKTPAPTTSPKSVRVAKSTARPSITHAATAPTTPRVVSNPKLAPSNLGSPISLRPAASLPKVPLRKVSPSVVSTSKKPSAPQLRPTVMNNPRGPRLAASVISALASKPEKSYAMAFTISWSEAVDIPITFLVDPSAEHMVLSSSFVRQYGVPTTLRQEAILITTKEGKEIEGAGLERTGRLVLRHKDHYSLEEFEVADLKAGDKCQGILPAGYLEEHTLEGGFASVRCLQECNKVAVAGYIGGGLRAHGLQVLKAPGTSSMLGKVSLKDRSPSRRRAMEDLRPTTSHQSIMDLEGRMNNLEIPGHDEKRRGSTGTSTSSEGNYDSDNQQLDVVA